MLLRISPYSLVCESDEVNLIFGTVGMLCLCECSVFIELLNELPTSCSIQNGSILFLYICNKNTSSLSLQAGQLQQGNYTTESNIWWLY